MQGLPFNLRDADPYTRSVIRSAADIISHTARRISWYLRMSSGGRMRELGTLPAEALDVSTSRSLEALFALVDQIHPRKPLRDYGSKAEELPVFAARVMKE